MKSVFGLILYGVPNPFDPTNINPVLYTDGELPSTGRPSELSSAQVEPIVQGRPGLNWGADPRAPVGQGDEAEVTLLDDEDGTLGTLLLEDRTAAFWGLNANRLSSSATSCAVVNQPAPSSGLYFLGNECLSVTYAGTTTGTPPTHSLTLGRARCGSTAKVHILRPSDYSAGEDGSEDRLQLHTRPQWDEGFYCGVYQFLLDAEGAISGYVLRRGVVAGEPTPLDGSLYQVKIRFLEDQIAEHKIGNGAEVTLSYRVVLLEMIAGPVQGLLHPHKAMVLVTAPQADQFLGDPTRHRGATLLNDSLVSDLNTRLLADDQSTWGIILEHDDTWVFTIDQVGVYSYAHNGQTLKAVALYLTLMPDGYSEGATVLTGQNPPVCKPWYRMSAASVYADGDTSGPPPKMRLRLGIRASVVQTFLKLCISGDGSSGADFDDLIGGVGMGIPAAFFNQGAASASALGVAGNTKELLQLDQLLNPINQYWFDLGRPIEMRQWLTNEAIGSQLLLGSLQNGTVTLTPWVHTEIPTVTLQPQNVPQKAGQRLPAVKRLDLAAGLRILDLEPVEKRSVRWYGTRHIKPEEVQAIRFWREGLNLTLETVTSGDLSQLVHVFYKIMGGAPFVYEVACTIEDHVNDGVEFGDSVFWSEPTLVRPSGLGIVNGRFFVVGIDLNYDDGICVYKLLQNTIPLLAHQAIEAGLIAPMLDTISVTQVSSLVVDVTVNPLGRSSFAPSTDYGGLFPEIQSNGGQLALTNFDQAPLGALEPIGALPAHATLTAVTVNPDNSVTLRLTVDSSYLRGDIATASDLFTAGETRIGLPARLPAEASLPGTLIEADAKASPDNENYLSYQPRTSLNGVLHTFG